MRCPRATWVWLMVLVCLATLAACSPAPGATATPAPTATSSSPSVAPSGPIGQVQPTGEPSAIPTPAATPAGEPPESEAPTPACPAPPNAVVLPNVVVTAESGLSVVATPGSSSVTTCSTVASNDVVPVEPTTGLVVRPGGSMTLGLPPGWHFLEWGGSDRPVAGEGANVWPPVATPDHPDHITVPVPARAGASIVSYDLGLQGLAGHAIAHLEASVRVDVR